MRINTETILADFDVTDLSGNCVGGHSWLGHAVDYSIQLVFTGSPVGTFKLQASIDPYSGSNPTGDTITNWTDVTDSDQAITAAGNHMWNVENAGYTWVRVIWTVTSGTGDLTVARIMTKGV